AGIKSLRKKGRILEVVIKRAQLLRSVFAKSNILNIRKGETGRPYFARRTKSRTNTPHHRTSWIPYTLMKFRDVWPKFGHNGQNAKRLRGLVEWGSSWRRVPIPN